jgi:hypothetical protein
MLRVTTSVLSRRSFRYNGVSDRCILSILFARQVKTDDCASLDGATLVADSADVAVICLLPSDSVCDQPATILCPNALETNLTNINGDHQHFRNRPAVRPARVGAALGG